MMKYFVIFALCCLALTAAAPQDLWSDISPGVVVLGPKVYNDNLGGYHVTHDYVKQFGEKRKTSGLH